jgi:hypothetical protein
MADANKILEGAGLVLSFLSALKSLFGKKKA